MEREVQDSADGDQARDLENEEAAVVPDSATDLASAPDPATASADDVGDDAAEAPAASDPVPVKLRSAPRFGVFIAVGVLVGVLTALVLVYALPSDRSSSPATAFTYLAVLLAPLTALLGGLLAVIFERRSTRRQ